MTRRLWRPLCLLTVAALLWPLMVASRGAAPAAAPVANGISDVVPFVGVLVGMRHRNQIYREANRFIADRRTYYDQLRETAGRQLVQREIGGLRPSQVAAYTKLVALIEERRAAEFAVAETFKREARAAFHDRVQSAIL